MNSASVITADWTESTFACCTIDEFEHGTLTVSDVRTGDVMRVFPEGTWRRATSFGVDGYPDFSFTSRMEA